MAKVRSPTTTSLTSDSFICRFLILSVNFEATWYNKVMNNLSTSTKESPLTQNLSYRDFAKIQYLPLVCLHPCHNQEVECHIKVATEALACGMRYGATRQTYTSTAKIKKDHETFRHSKTI